MGPTDLGLGIDNWVTDKADESNESNGDDPAETRRTTTDTSNESNGDDPAETQTYNGLARDKWAYTGDDWDAFKRWRSGEIRTRKFQTLTGPGQGTSALSRTEPSNQPDPSNQQTPGGEFPIGLAVVGLLAVVVVMEVA